MGIKKYVLVLIVAGAVVAGLTQGISADNTNPKLLQDVKIQPLDFKWPSIQKSNLKYGGKFYALTDDIVPLVRLDLFFYGGRLLEDKSSLGVHDMMATTLRQSGSSGYNGFKLDYELEKIGARISIGADSSQTNISASFLVKDFDKVLTIIGDLIKNPQYDPAVLNQVKARAIESIKRRNDNPASLGHRKLNELLMQNSILGVSRQIADVQKLDMSLIKSVHTQVFNRRNVDICISGNFTTAAAKSKLAVWLSGLPDGQRLASAVATKKEEVAEKSPFSPGYKGSGSVDNLEIYLVNKKLPQSTVIIGTYALPHKDARYPSAKVMNHILGAGSFNSRLFRIIRSDKGLSYSAYSYMLPSKNYGVFKAFAQTKTKTTGEVVDVFMDIFNDYKKNGPTPAELDWAKKSIVQKFVFLFEKTHSTLLQQYELDEKGMAPNYLQTFRQKISSVSPKQTKDMANLFLASRKMAIVIVGDKAKVMPQLSKYAVKEIPAE